MEKFYLEIPSLKRKDDITEYIQEFVNYNSDLNGIGSLYKMLEGYSFEEALDRCLKMSDANFAKINNTCQSKTYLLIRENDERIVGAINIRWNLPLKMQKFGGNIGYGIRPTERRKGYNKINLYLGLKEAKKLGMDVVTLSCEEDNIGSKRTMIDLGGIHEITEIDSEDNLLTSVYKIDVDKSLKKYEDTYKGFIR